MPLTKQEWLDLEAKANQLRHTALDTTLMAGSGHIGGSLSSMDILTVLYYKYMNIKKDDPTWADRDRFILSKGHIGIGYAGLLCDLGWNDPEQLKTFNLTNSKMGVHLDSNKVVGVDASTGSLGHGLSIAVGTALAARVQKKSYITYCLLGDGECDEGSVWEAALQAHQFKLDNLVAIIDHNRMQSLDFCENTLALEPFGDKWRAFGWNVIETDGNDVDAVEKALRQAQENRGSGRPTVVIAVTTKGKGVSFMENDILWHYRTPQGEEYDAALAELEAQRP